ncbi:hypothetical protein T552_02875 [Pneumocystis carinii B80]|uniref:Uncharacterized protein n=1 Tax=Pneumocystis carinii (strain B80) TaxID=1408658 RepID=A0A0W4ZDC5_PNEC8|nr:hypothetical protein T552_02875 [Pneumocystis carinii B80]KTW26393.1 hypothetical protein T552_02875 [Pneumocystis carinii B80]
MRFNYILSGVLALISVVSAAFGTASQLSSEIRLKEMVDLDYTIQYASIKLVLVCLSEGVLNDLYILKEGLSSVGLSESKVKFTHLSKECQSFFVKVLAYDKCGNLFVYFSSGFSVTLAGKVEYHKDCVPAKTIETAKTTKTSTLPTGGSKQTQTPDTHRDETPTKTRSETSGDKGQEKPTPGRSIPLPSTGKIEPTQKPTTSSSQTSADVKPTKKPDDIDNSGSMLAFKLVGTLFTVLVIFLCS